MRILIAGACGFVGSRIARFFANAFAGSNHRLELFGMDNFSRPGSESNRNLMHELGGKLLHGDLRMASDLESVPSVDWVIDAAANPGVLSGVDGQTSSRQILQHNLDSTINMLEYCKRCNAGFTLISTSRVYAINSLQQIALIEQDGAYTVDSTELSSLPVSANGISESFPTLAPISLYGSSKLASEMIALEYAHAFDFPVWINRCGVLAGAGQFGRADQGIVSFWINEYKHRKPLTYIGYGGSGLQTRDCLHPNDLARLMLNQIKNPAKCSNRVFNIGGGLSNSFSLSQLSHWCQQQFGTHKIQAELVERQYDIPWLIMDSTVAKETWNWQPEITRLQIFDEIAFGSASHPSQLEIAA